MAEGSEGQFTGWDWAVFAVALVASLGTGVVAGWIGRRKAQKGNSASAAEEFLMGGRAFNPIAAGLSTMIGAISATTVLGNPGEMYAYGTQLWMNMFGLALGFVFIHFVYLAVLYRLKITSVYTYIEKRFQSKGLLLFMLYTSMLGALFYMGLSAYSPSLAMETVTGLPAWVSIVILGVICTIYSTWGGVRAVVYTDVLQVFVMLTGVVVIIVTAVGDVGGLASVWDIAWDHGRVEWWNLNPDPLQRHSFWLVNIQGFFFSLIVFGFTQQQIQRICSVATFKKAIGAHYISLLILITVFCLCNFMGVAVFAVYADCDPMATEEIDKPDEIVPYYVIDRLSRLPGLPGLFIAALYAGGLSSYSSTMNGIVAVVWEHLFKNSQLVAGMREERRPYVNMVVSVVAGLLGVVAGIISTRVVGLFQAIQVFHGTVLAPQLGVFLLGMMCPFANALGSVIGLTVSFAFNLWVTLGAMFSDVSSPYLDFSDEGCNATSTFPPTASSAYLSSSFSSASTVPPFASTTEGPEDPDVFPLYLMSYNLYTFTGVSITFFVGAIASLLTKPWSTERSGKSYIHPTFYALQRRWEKRRAPKNPPSVSSQNLVALEKY